MNKVLLGVFALIVFNCGKKTVEVSDDIKGLKFLKSSHHWSSSNSSFCKKISNEKDVFYRNGDTLSVILRGPVCPPYTASYTLKDDTLKLKYESNGGACLDTVSQGYFDYSFLVEEETSLYFSDFDSLLSTENVAVKKACE